MGSHAVLCTKHDISLTHIALAQHLQIGLYSCANTPVYGANHVSPQAIA
jgi:hypothetical protein